MIEYGFTEYQLRKLLKDCSNLEKEYIQKHGHAPSFAQLCAINDTIDGLNAERELFSNEEIETMTMQLYSMETFETDKP